MAYQIVAIPMTLSDIQRDARNVRLLKCDFSHSYAAVNRILIGLQHVGWSLTSFSAQIRLYQRREDFNSQLT